MKSDINERPENIEELKQSKEYIRWVNGIPDSILKYFDEIYEWNRKYLDYIIYWKLKCIIDCYPYIHILFYVDINKYIFINTQFNIN